MAVQSTAVLGDRHFHPDALLVEQRKLDEPCLNDELSFQDLACEIVAVASAELLYRTLAVVVDLYLIVLDLHNKASVLQ